jgi:hypothetical protein
MEVAMTTLQEQRGICLIEAGARDLQNGEHWQPWVRLTRTAEGESVSQTFDRLKPVFGTEEAALRYAAELGRSLADDGSALDAAARERKPARWPLRQPYAWSRTHRSRKSPLAAGCSAAARMIRALAGIFVRCESARNMARQPRVELCLDEAADHAELERSVSELERSAVSFSVTFSH